MFDLFFSTADFGLNFCFFPVKDYKSLTHSFKMLFFFSASDKKTKPKVFYSLTR